MRLRRLLGTDMPVALVLAFALLPFLWMALSSLRPEEELTRAPLVVHASTLGLAQYITLLGRTSFAANLRDSLVVATGAVLLGLALAVPAAYAFSRFRFRGRGGLRITSCSSTCSPSCCSRCRCSS